LHSVVLGSLSFAVRRLTNSEYTFNGATHAPQIICGAFVETEQIGAFTDNNIASTHTNG
jgi:hypothetical protein